jgi:hypothetical protein
MHLSNVSPVVRFPVLTQEHRFDEKGIFTRYFGFVIMHAVGHYFPDCIVTGPQTTYDEFGGSYCSGYRCEQCNRIFFGLVLEDLRHECMETDER